MKTNLLPYLKYGRNVLYIGEPQLSICLLIPPDLNRIRNVLLLFYEVCKDTLADD